jgi:isopenicillin N synthase-like dioxygenase
VETSRLDGHGFVPVIDISYRRGSLPRRRELARSIAQACRESGFLVIVGHGFDAALRERMCQQTTQFFLMNDAAKSVVETSAATPRGWKREGGYVAASSGVETPPDLCEMYTCNRLGDPHVAEQSGLGNRFDQLSGRNQFPSEPAGFEMTWRRYYQAMESLASELMALFALALDLPEDWFEDKIDHHMSNLCANWYYSLAATPLPGQMRKGPHTDWGSLTILHQDDAGGLQVLDPTGTWIDVPCVADSFVINIGDLMANWTNNQWVSTMHRVVSNEQQSRRHRLSIAFFHQPNCDARIECLPTCCNVDTPPRHRAVYSGDWLEMKLDAATRGSVLQLGDTDRLRP